LPDFHSTLALSASFIDFYLGRAPSVVTLAHIARAYSSVNMRLSADDGLSDQALAGVIALTILERLHAQHSIGHIHLHGLQQMIGLRGGMVQLADSHDILVKLWR
jgi:uncharacterized lipoprotein YajG